MNKILVFTTAAFGVGIALGPMVTALVSPAHAAQNAVVIKIHNDQDAQRVAATCDFSKSMVAAGPFVVCQQR